MFLFADYLQLDVSVAPTSKFHPTSPRFKLLFGEANEPEHVRPPSAFEGAIARSLDRDELLSALTARVKGLLRECELGDDDERIRQRLREMAG